MQYIEIYNCACVKMSTTRSNGDGDDSEVSSDDDGLPCYFVDLTHASVEECTSVTGSIIGQSTVDLTGTNSDSSMTTGMERSPEKKRYR